MWMLAGGGAPLLVWHDRRVSQHWDWHHRLSMDSDVDAMMSAPCRGGTLRCWLPWRWPPRRSCATSTCARAPASVRPPLLAPLHQEYLHIHIRCVQSLWSLRCRHCCGAAAWKHVRMHSCPQRSAHSTLRCVSVLQGSRCPGRRWCTALPSCICRRRGARCPSPPPSPPRRCRGGCISFQGQLLCRPVPVTALQHLSAQAAQAPALLSVCHLMQMDQSSGASTLSVLVFCRSVMPNYTPAPPPSHPQMRLNAVHAPVWPQPPQQRTLQQAVQQLYPAPQRVLRCHSMQQQSQRQQQLQQPAPPLQLQPLPGGSIWSSSAVGTTGWPTAASA